MGSLHVPGDLQACQGRAYGIAMVQDAHSESTLKLESCTYTFPGWAADPSRAVLVVRWGIAHFTHILEFDSCTKTPHPHLRMYASMSESSSSKCDSEWMLRAPQVIPIHYARPCHARRPPRTRRGLEGSVRSRKRPIPVCAQKIYKICILKTNIPIYINLLQKSLF